jgi:hypothetical protein
VEASLSSWLPTRSFNLITCVHGLHYIGDKLGLVTRVITWLTDDGMFVGTLDMSNIKLADGSGAGRIVSSALRRDGLEYDRRRRLVTCRGKRTIKLPFRYIGADDQAGPNFTGQPAVNTYYEVEAIPSC